MDEVAPPALEAAADNPEGSFTSAAAKAARSRAAEATEEVPACWDTTGPGVEKKEASLPTLKAAGQFYAGRRRGWPRGRR